MGAVSTIGDRRWFVYTLSDPLTDAIRYVGWTVDVKRRLYLNIWRSENCRDYNTHKTNWIRSLISSGGSPVITVVEEGIGDGWKTAEPKWIAHFKSIGCKLTNLTDGGPGTYGIVVKPSTRAKISKLHKGQNNWQNGLAAAKLKNKGSKQTPEQIEKVANANRGKKRSAEFCAALGARTLGRKASDETKAKLSAMRKGRKMPAEMSAAITKRNLERWASLRASLKEGEKPHWSGMKRTPEQCERIKVMRNPHLYPERYAELVKEKR